MDFSLLLTIKNFFLKSHAYILKKFNKKLSDIDNYKDEKTEVDRTYTITSTKCLAEEKNGATFRWSKKMFPGYEKYFEIYGNTRRYFTSKNEFLWIKRI